MLLVIDNLFFIFPKMKSLEHTEDSQTGVFIFLEFHTVLIRNFPHLCLLLASFQHLLSLSDQRLAIGSDIGL